MEDRKSANTGLKSEPAVDKSAPEGSRYIYRGSALAVGGRITRIGPHKDLDCLVPQQAAVVLPVVGGKSESELKRCFRFRIANLLDCDAVQVGSAAAKAESPKWVRGAGWRSAVSCRVKDFRARRLSRKERHAIVVEEVFAGFTSEHGAEDSYPKVRPDAKSALSGLSLDGLAVKVKIDVSLFREFPTKQALDELIRQQPEIARRIAWRPGKPPEKGAACTIVTEVSFPKGKPDGVVYDPAIPNWIYWAGIGNIYLGEMVVADYWRQLTMVRIVLGCDMEGSLAVDQIEDGGHTLP